MCLRVPARVPACVECRARLQVRELSAAVEEGLKRRGTQGSEEAEQTEEAPKSPKRRSSRSSFRADEPAPVAEEAAATEEPAPAPVAESTPEQA